MASYTRKMWKKVSKESKLRTGVGGTVGVVEESAEGAMSRRISPLDAFHTWRRGPACPCCVDIPRSCPWHVLLRSHHFTSLRQPILTNPQGLFYCTWLYFSGKSSILLCHGSAAAGSDPTINICCHRVICGFIILMSGPDITWRMSFLRGSMQISESSNFYK